GTLVISSLIGLLLPILLLMTKNGDTFTFKYILCLKVIYLKKWFSFVNILIVFITSELMRQIEKKMSKSQKYDIKQFVNFIVLLSL
ncbi:hypothetical protein VSP10_17620, partial [Myroides odoratimimus]|uniref:hypothetical protein n=1 Tax=Myroides odoratimimus TaxID=76832 RepID=UPI002DBC7628